MHPDGLPALDLPLSRRGFLGLTAATAAALSPLGRLTALGAALPTYLLPYPGGLMWQCIQGNNSGGSHSGNSAFAWDFRMPQGSPVVAAREGVVSMLKQDSYQSCPQNIYSCPEWNNYVVIDHGDGTSAVYLHGFQNGARVRLGQRVRQGEILTISGTTGQSGAPHLHFAVQYTGHTYISQSFPIGFAEVSENGGVPVRRGHYRSANARWLDFDIRGGHFYTQSNGSGRVGTGFAVSDDGGIPMWSTLIGGGGVSTIGFPLSRRFQVANRIYQMFQRQMFEWDGAAKQMRAINIPELPAAPVDPDAWLRDQTALPLDSTFAEYERAWSQYAAGQLAFLEGQPRMKEAYYAAEDPIRRFGLPLGPVTEAFNGMSIQLKARYAYFSISKRDTPFSKAGDLTVSQATELILDAEPFSRRVFEPEQLFAEDPVGFVIPGPPPS
jgi:murein DD-endopeptidase MepM/ murein hydrolase activator NlpD